MDSTIISATTDHLLHVVLIHPEIPQNTGTIGRSCVAMNAVLHLVKPLAFDIDEKAVRRAGLDYWKFLDLRMHENLEELEVGLPKNAPKYLIENKPKFPAVGPIYQAQFMPPSVLIFGRETTGIPDDFLARYPDRVFDLPMFSPRVRSLNLSNCVSVVMFEALRQIKNWA